MEHRPSKKLSAPSVALACSALLLFSFCAPPPPPKMSAPKPTVLMILADVTRSLEGSEVKQVAKLAVDVLDRFPENTDYVIYPIQMETERPTAIDEGHASSATHVKLTDEEKNARRKTITREIEETYEKVNKKQPVDRTCILNSLDMADKHFYQKAAGFPTSGDKSPCMELVIISDMIEQCGINSIKKRIDLQEQQVSEAIELSKEIKSLPDLSRLHISVIIPTSKESTPYVRHRPRLGDLEEFWNAIFERCGFKAETLKSFNWLPTVPERLGHGCE